MAKPIIDESQFNGTVNWELVKKQVDGAIIRCGYGGNVAKQDDTQYLRNVKECTRLKIPFGVYLFSYARSAAEARDEADHVLRLVKGWNLALPIYYDLERSNYVGDMSAALYTQIANAFCKRIEAAGGFVGIYANLDYWNNKLMNVNDYTRWLAQWSSTPTYDKAFKLWQYTSDAKVEGSSERNDLSRYYDDFLTMAGKRNYFGDDTPDPKPEPPTKLKYKVGDDVSFRALYRSSDSCVPISFIAIHRGKITRVIEKARNPYLINDGTGWVNDAVITTKHTPKTYQVGDKVRFHALYVSSDATEAVTDIAVHQGTITKIVADARNPYLINNGTGWVNNSVIDGYAEDSSTLKVKDLVKVKKNAPDYQGNPLAPFVYDTVYEVMEIKGDRVVIGKNNQVTAAVATKNLIKV